LVKNLRYSDIYRNVARYLKKYEGKEGFKGTRAYLETLIDQPVKVESVILKMKSLGASCDYEVISKVKPQINGGTFLVVLD
jgi:hypothetical protein